jgi:hypothetical protein
VTQAATDQLKAHVSAVWARYHKPIWITEYALMRFDGGTKYPIAVESAFVGQSTAMLRTLPYVERYAWFSLTTPGRGWRRHRPLPPGRHPHPGRPRVPGGELGMHRSAGRFPR